MLLHKELTDSTDPGQTQDFQEHTGDTPLIYLNPIKILLTVVLEVVLEVLEVVLKVLEVVLEVALKVL